MKLQLSPIDTWFFRDGTPFDMDGSPQSGVVGMFPPHPPTLAGAVRAALARRNGWDGRGRWSGGELAAILGDGPADPGQLRITGPLVLRHGAPVFPMPRHVVGRSSVGGEWAPVTFMRPGREPTISDLGGRARLPETGERQLVAGSTPLDPGDGRWVTLGGLRRILRGELPQASEIILDRALWSGESRVGIARCAASRTVVDGALYSTRHVRPAMGTSLGIAIAGVPVHWRSPAGDVIPLGGESRLAGCETWRDETGDAALALDGPLSGVRTAVIVALTPVLLDASAGCAAVSLLGARIISACVDRPLRIGGWDSVAHAPLTLRNAAPPGTVWFCEIEDLAVFQRSIVGGLLRVGAATATGFGLCAVGSAPRWEDAT